MLRLTGDSGHFVAVVDTVDISPSLAVSMATCSTQARSMAGGADGGGSSGAFKAASRNIVSRLKRSLISMRS